ncbi:hypothetical protein SDC9_162317 [bioreactor metagenome]|uniref:Uncharacterized protein n=1 Tax=bioreactor metagenome TaxID=1076179 RepID=A0A645FKQ1_9ZZZZ
MIEAAAIDAEIASPPINEIECKRKFGSGTASINTASGCGHNDEIAAYMPLIVA